MEALIAFMRQYSFNPIEMIAQSGIVDEFRRTKDDDAIQRIRYERFTGNRHCRPPHCSDHQVG